jgi:AcrR family transcriptional regulator
MQKRLTRDQRRERTRTDLLEAARQVFLERGFHGASLEEISSAAGYTTGALQSNFESKDQLFLAVFDEYSASRVRSLVDAVLDEASFEQGVRAGARLAWQATLDEPRWNPLLVEFWTHAARREPTRHAMSERHERSMVAIATLIEELARRHGMEYVIPAREVARGSAALVRGMVLERVLNPNVGDSAQFEEMWTAMTTGLAQTRKET